MKRIITVEGEYLQTRNFDFGMDEHGINAVIVGLDARNITVKKRKAVGCDYALQGSDLEIEITSIDERRKHGFRYVVRDASNRVQYDDVVRVLDNYNNSIIIPQISR